MILKSVRVRNYQCFKDTGTIELSPKINLILGKNNAGKSALLRAICTPGAKDPHKSYETIPKETSNQENSVTSLIFQVEGRALIQRMRLQTGLPNHLILPMGFFNTEGSPNLDILAFEGKRFEISADYEGNTIRMRWPNDDNPPFEKLFLNLRFQDAVIPISQISLQTIGGYGDDLLQHMIRATIQRFWYFRPDVTQCGTSPANIQQELQPALNNLASVIDELQSNSRQFKRYIQEVKKVLPDIETIKSRTIQDGTKAVHVWFHSEDSERSDLAVPLASCGTGIRTVLALLYVAINSQEPRTIFVDEIHSFLHPGALRNLLQRLVVLGDHQIIASTHSPILLGSPETSRYIHIIREEFASKVTSVDSKSKLEVDSLLADLGVRLSDVFGAERIFWVEGATEEKCIPQILAKLRPDELVGTVVLGVRSTSQFSDRKTIEATVELYSKISGLGFVMPRRVAFLFDREGKEPSDIEDLQRRADGKVRFLRRQMFEDYLLHPGAIAHVLNAELKEERVLPETVKEKLDELSQETKINADKILKQMFDQLSGSTVEFRKTAHTVSIVNWLLENESSYLNELKAEIVDALNV